MPPPRVDDPEDDGPSFSSPLPEALAPPREADEVPPDAASRFPCCDGVDGPVEDEYSDEPRKDEQRSGCAIEEVTSSPAKEPEGQNRQDDPSRLVRPWYHVRHQKGSHSSRRCYIVRTMSTVACTAA